jgi:hypothetical protein
MRLVSSLLHAVSTSTSSVPIATAIRRVARRSAADWASLIGATLTHVTVRDKWAFAEAARYNRAVRPVIVIVAALVAGCGHPADPQQPVPPSSSSTRAFATPTHVAGGGSGATQVVVLPAVGCPSPTCALHAGTGSYFTCLSSGAGACFHFGPSCAPPDACMYDPVDRSYKQCARASEGACQQWGAPCAPATRCMFNPADGAHHRCEDVAGGACKRYGALCAP